MGICGFDETWEGRNKNGQSVGALGSKINSCAHVINCCILKGERNVENIVKVCIDQGYTNFQKNGLYTKEAKTPIEGMANKVLGHIDWIHKKDRHPTHNFLLTLQKIHNPETVECILNAVCAETKGMIGQEGGGIGNQETIEEFLPDWPYVKIVIDIDLKEYDAPTIDEILDEIEDKARRENKALKKNWREITRRNIPPWLAAQSE